MNLAESYLHTKWGDFGLGSVERPNDLACVLITPRFAASAHVVYLFLDRDTRFPVVAVKIPRSTEGADALHNEAANLVAVGRDWPESAGSVPRVLAFEEWRGVMLLVETGVPGPPLSADYVLRNRERCAEMISTWCEEVGRATASRDPEPVLQFERLIGGPLRALDATAPQESKVVDLVRLTLDILEPRGRVGLPSAFEHGDLAAPNLMIADQRLGVVDWELANPKGLALNDLFFGLTFVAIAGAQARGPADCVRAFHDAFCSHSAWAIPHVERVAARLELPRDLLTPLMIASWARYVARVPERLSLARGGHGDPTADWFESSRFAAIWRHTVENIDRLGWNRLEKVA